MSFLIGLLIEQDKIMIQRKAHMAMTIINF